MEQTALLVLNVEMTFIHGDGNMKLSYEDMERLANYLQGTCLSLNEASQQLFDKDVEEFENELQICNYIDNVMFCCTQCSLWFDASDWVLYENNPEADNGDICYSCGQENGWVE